jgi:hypothetical protein
MDNYLAHHGIKGQRWGVRRYQNEDGTLTRAGKQRYRDLDDRESFQRETAQNNYRKARQEYDRGHRHRAAYHQTVGNAFDHFADRTALDRKAYTENLERDRRASVKRQREWNAKNASLLSDEELNRQINRLMKERQLSDLSEQVVTPGRKKVKDLIGKYGDMFLNSAVGAAAGAYATAYISKRINPGKSEYDRKKEQFEANQRLIDEGYAEINSNGKLRQVNRKKK